MKKRLFILVPGVAMGGAELLACFQSALLADDYAIHLLVMDRVEDARPMEEFGIVATEVQLHEFKSGLSTLTGRKLLKTFVLVPSLVAFIRKYRPVALIAHLPPAHFIARLAAFCCGRSIKVIHYHHGLEFEESPLNSSGKKMFHSINRFIARAIQEKHCYNSNAVKQHYEAYFNTPTAAGVLIYNAVSEEEVFEHTALNYLQEQGIQKKNHVLVLPGRVQAVKGQLFFLPVFEAFCRLSTNLNLQLIIAGGGPDERLLRERIKALNLEDKVFVTGTVSRPMLLSFISMADLVVVPSLVEGLGNVAIEALMQGKEVLASDAGGLAEVVVDGYNGYSFKKNNYEDCLRQLKNIFEGRSKGQHIDKAMIRKSFEERFLPSHHKAVLKEYIRKCAE